MGTHPSPDVSCFRRALGTPGAQHVTFLLCGATARHRTVGLRIAIALAPDTPGLAALSCCECPPVGTTSIAETSIVLAWRSWLTALQRSAGAGARLAHMQL